MEHHKSVQAVLREFDVPPDRAPTLLLAADTAQSYVEEARVILHELLDDELCAHLDVIAMGSLARGEVTSASDLDALVVMHGVSDHHQAALDQVERAVREVRGRLALGESGGTGTFGEVVAAPDLVHRVGLEADTNTQHTRRLLTLMESVSLYEPRRHEALLRAIVARYLDEHDSAAGTPPRFIINDVLRYWRTMTIDYQAKTWQADQAKWAARHLKLLSTRKLLVAGTLSVALTLPEEDTHEALLKAMQEPGLARLARMARQTADGVAAMTTVVNVMEEFLAAFDDDEVVGALRGLTDKATAMDNTRFRELSDASKDLHDALVTIVHKSDEKRSMKYLML